MISDSFTVWNLGTKDSTCSYIFVVLGSSTGSLLTLLLLYIWLFDRFLATGAAFDQELSHIIPCDTVATTARMMWQLFSDRATALSTALFLTSTRLHFFNLARNGTFEWML